MNRYLLDIIRNSDDPVHYFIFIYVVLISDYDKRWLFMQKLKL